MMPAMDLMDAVIETDYGQFDLLWPEPDEPGGLDGNFDRFFAGQTNGLVGAAEPSGLYVNLARRSGGSQVRIVMLDQQPTAPDTSIWEDVVEVSVSIPLGREVWCECWGGAEPKDLAIPSGTYRVRVSAHGRDAGAENELCDDIVDSYLIEFWPAPSAPDGILAVGSEDARYWHKEIGGRR